MSKWPVVKIGDILTERREAPSPDDLLYGRVRIVSKIGFDTGRIELRSESKTNTGLILAHPGDLLISGINASKGAIAIYGAGNVGAIAATIHYSAYTPRPDRGDLKFLWWFFRSHHFQKILAHNVPGGIKTELKAKRFLPIPIPLPPLAEQRRIVARIEELAAQINEARELRKQAESAVEMLDKLGMWNLFERMSSAYPTRPLSKVVAIRGGGTPSKSNPFYWNGEIPWITPKDMKVRVINDSIGHISELATQESSAKLLPKDAVLVVVRGMILAHTFPAAVLSTTAAINQDMKALIPNDKILPEFLCTLFWAKNSQLVELVEKSTHDTRKLETNKLQGIQIPVPPLSEQRRIVTELDALQAEVDALKRLQAETAAELDALLPAVLDHAFKGDL